MAVGLAPGTADDILDALCQAAATFDVDAIWLQLHTGDPGAAGTANQATETTRVQATFGTSASGGLISNTVAVDWTSVAAAETYTHFSAWSLVTAGVFHFSGTVSGGAVTAGSDFSIPIGDLDVSFSVAA